MNNWLLQQHIGQMDQSLFGWLVQCVAAVVHKSTKDGENRELTSPIIDWPLGCKARQQLSFNNSLRMKLAAILLVVKL